VWPDRLHVFMTLPAGGSDDPNRWRSNADTRDAAVKAGAPIVRRRNGELALWQGRFWKHTIRDDGTFERHADDIADYIHVNPVKHCRARARGAVRAVSSLRSARMVAAGLS
jgi:putative transposase